MTDSRISYRIRQFRPRSVSSVASTPHCSSGMRRPARGPRRLTSTAPTCSTRIRIRVPSISTSGRNYASFALRDVDANGTTERGRNASVRTVSAVGKGREGSTDIGSSVRDRPNELGQECLSDGLKVVEGSDTECGHTIVGVEVDLGRDAADGPCDWCHDDPGQHGYRLGSGNDQHWTSLVLGLGPPDVPLGEHHHGSSSIMRMVASSDQPISLSAWGCC